MNNQIKTFKYSDTENGHKSNRNVNIWKQAEKLKSREMKDEGGGDVKN